MANKEILTLTEEVSNAVVKTDEELTDDYKLLLELKTNIDLIINTHLREIESRIEDNSLKSIGKFEVKYPVRNYFNKDKAEEYVKLNGLEEKYTVIKPAYMVEAEKYIDYKEIQKELKKLDNYNRDYCDEKVGNLELKKIMPRGFR